MPKHRDEEDETSSSEDEDLVKKKKEKKKKSKKEKKSKKKQESDSDSSSSSESDSSSSSEDERSDMINSKMNNNANDDDDENEPYPWTKTFVHVQFTGSLNELKNNPGLAKLSLSSNQKAFSTLKNVANKSTSKKKNEISNKNQMIVDGIELVKIQHTAPVALGFKIEGMNYEGAKSFSASNATEAFLHISDPRENSKLKGVIAKGASNGVHHDFIREYPKVNTSNIRNGTTIHDNGKFVTLSQNHPIASRYQEYFATKKGVEVAPLSATENGNVEMKKKDFERVEKYITKDILTEQASIVDPKNLFLVFARAYPGEGTQLDGSQWTDSQELKGLMSYNKDGTMNTDALDRILNTPFNLYATLLVTHELH